MRKASESSGSRRRFLGVVTAVCLLLAVVGGAVALQELVPGAKAIAELNSDRLYHRIKVWTPHFRVLPDQWAAMEPKGQAKGFVMFSGGGMKMGRRLAPVFMPPQQNPWASSSGSGSFPSV